MFNLPVMCLNRKYGVLIGEMLGVVEDVEVEDDDTRWGRFLRVKI